MHLNKRLTETLLIIVLSLTLLIPVMADTKEDVRQEINSLEGEQSAVESELADLKSTKDDLEAYIQEIDNKLNDILENMNELSDEIVELSNEIHTVQLKMIEARASQDEQYKALSARIKAMYESGEDDYLQLLLGASDLKSFLNEAEYREKINSYDYHLLNQLQETADQIEHYKKDLETRQNEMKEKIAEYESEKTSLESVLREREEELASVDSSIVSKSDEILAIQDKIAAENQKMADILNEEKRQELERQAEKKRPVKTEGSSQNSNTENDDQTETSDAASGNDQTNDPSSSDQADRDSKQREPDTAAEQETQQNETPSEKEEKPASSTAASSTYNGPVLTRSAGTIIGPSGKETYYNLDMSGVVRIMRNMGFSEEEYPYWVRDDGCKMLGDYIICAANLNVRPRGTTVESSLGTCLVCDTGGFASYNSTQIDIATDW